MLIRLSSDFYGSALQRVILIKENDWHRKIRSQIHGLCGRGEGESRTLRDVARGLEGVWRSGDMQKLPTLDGASN